MPKAAAKVVGELRGERLARCNAHARQLRSAVLARGLSTMARIMVGTFTRTVGLYFSIS